MRVLNMCAGTGLVNTENHSLRHTKTCRSVDDGCGSALARPFETLKSGTEAPLMRSVTSCYPCTVRSADGLYLNSPANGQMHFSARWRIAFRSCHQIRTRPFKDKR